MDRRLMGIVVQMMGIASLHPSYNFRMNLIVGWVEAYFTDTHRTFALNSKAKPELRPLPPSPSEYQSQVEKH